MHGEALRKALQAIDGRGYKAYQEIRGSYDLGDWQLFADHIQGDPFAAPSRFRARVPAGRAAFPRELFAAPVRRVALEDYLTRRLARSLAARQGRRGSGKSGLLAVDRPGQEVLQRTSMQVTEEYVEARLSVGLPAAGRSVLGREAARMLLEELPEALQEALLYTRLPREEVWRHVRTVEDQEALRAQLAAAGLVAFVGDGSVLPRLSGVSDLPLRGERVVRFTAPPTLAVELEAPNRGRVRGMGIPAGVTLIVGGGYHGKSTLLRALERGVYNHVPGDGRELVVTLPGAVKIRAEDGRRVEKVDISPFITNLPFGQPTERFSTEEASGSTSQAANIMEALELGAQVLLLDEDTSATNFLIRDARMQQLVRKEKEPITPFIDRVRQLYRERGVSSVLVVGGAGDYLDVADTVIMMDEYRARDVSEEARRVAAAIPSGRRAEEAGPLGRSPDRVPLPESFNPQRGQRTRVGARGVDNIRFGEEQILLQGVEQLVDPSQTRAIADAIHYLAARYCDGRRPLRELVELVFRDIGGGGLDVISPFRGQHPGDYALPRPLELAAAINRLRTLRVR